ncbi:oligoribonuclease, mitochondrial [Solea senegalensis]|uniref:Oligoribonuclease, mitochondrial n=1 Tax=Solea senegalensis TaxID=28829 RepID=A0AAV6SF25_SOLSE|nr:oligoribonuclease, mitochondrial [Solea senegalensis]
MPVCLRTSACSLSLLKFFRSNSRPVLVRSAVAVCYSHRGVAPFSSVIKSLNTRTGTGLTSRLAFGFDVRVSGRRSIMSSAAMSQRMVWVDLEMTGLDIEKDQIIEMACIITDSDLNILAESGLTKAVQDSKITLEQAEYEFLSFVRQHTPPGQCPLAGNSVHADKRFLDKHMPQFMYHLHYRIIDVSTIKELCRRWFPEEYKMAPHKKASHRALGDIRESIKELQFYRTNVFKGSTERKCKVLENGHDRS